MCMYLPSSRSKEMSHVYELIAKENWETILHHDELNREIRSTRVLNGFTALQVWLASCGRGSSSNSSNWL